jgi:hypothetical protein
MVLEENAVRVPGLQAQVERILQSEEFRSSEVVRRLLLYLMEKAISGEADQLKEYTVAIEGLGKPSSYDPQHNSTVRIHVGRLRQKLAEYYREEGKDDEIIVHLPKGRFKLTCETRATVPDDVLAPPIFMPPSLPDAPLPASAHHSTSLRPALFGLLTGLVLAACLFLVWHSFVAANNAGNATAWTPDLEALWGPLVVSNRPLILSIEDPLFVEVQSNPGVYYRDRSMNDWKGVEGSAAVKQLSQTFGTAKINPSRYYTAFGEAEAALYLGQLLHPHKQNLTMTRTSQLSWQQLADNNVVFVGVQNLFFEQLQGMPVASELTADLKGIRNTHPAAGEPEVYVDEYTTAPSEQGVIYSLVTRVPGPQGSTDVESFTSIRSAGYVGAVQFFTNPESASLVVQKLKEKNGGKMPRSYQVLLKTKFKDNVPTETTYVLSRLLH